MIQSFVADFSGGGLRTFRFWNINHMAAWYHDPQIFFEIVPGCTRIQLRDNELSI